MVSPGNEGSGNVDDSGLDSHAVQEDDAFVRRLLERAGPRPPLPEADLAAITERARAAWEWQLRKRARTSVRRVVWPLITILAASLALTVGLAWWATSNGALVSVAVARVEAVAGAVSVEAGASAPRRIAMSEEIPIGAVLSSGGAGFGAGRVALRLANGAVVRLDENSRVQLAAAGTVRLERGAVYVDTGAGAAAGGTSVRSVEVWTPAGVARDIGTQFSVRIEDSATPGLHVQVREGAVEVERAHQRHLAPAGEELLLGADGSVKRRAVARSGPEWAWTLAAAGGFAIEGRTMEEFLAWVARETGWRVRFEDPSLAEAAKGIVLHGGIGLVRPDQAPFVVLPGAGWACESVGGVLVVRHALAQVG